MNMMDILLKMHRIRYRKSSVEQYRRALAAAVDFEIEILQTDINAGSPGDCSECPIALASVRAYGLYQPRGDVAEVMVDSDGKGGGMEGLLVLDYWHWDDRRSRKVRKKLPKNALEFIRSFDEDGKAAPFSFRPTAIGAGSHSI